MRRMLALVALAACGGTGGGITVRDAVVRVAPAEARNAAGYLVIANSGRVADTLRALSSDAGPVELHRTREEGGLLRMEPVPALALAPGAAVALEPGGYHAMIRPLVRHVAPGDSVTLVLDFAHAGAVTLRVPVRAVGRDD